MSRRVLAAFVAVTLVLSAVPATAAPEEQVIGEPELELSAPENRFAPSERGALTLVVSNGGDVQRGGPGSFTQRVTTARNVRVSIAEDRVDAPIEFKSGDVLLGAVSTARPARATFQLETSEDLQPGTYRIPVRLEYDYTRIVTYEEGRTGPQDPDFDDSSRDRIVDVEVVVERDSQFAVRSETTAGLYAGDTGRLNVTLTNTGTETARDATLQLTAGSPSVAFGPRANPQQSTTVFVSDLEPDESTTASVRVGAPAETTPGSYPVEARVVYENDNGVTAKSDPMPTEVRVGPERRFSIENLRTERLRVGEDDVIVTAEVVNRGPASARNAVVTLAAGSSAGSASGGGPGAGTGGAPGGAAPPAGGSPGPILVTSAESGVGTLEPGESREVRFKMAVSEDAEPGSQTLNFAVEYENSDGDLRRSTSPIRESVDVGAERDTFEVVDVETGVAAGGSDVLRLTVEHTGTEPVSDANAKLFVNDPLSAPDNSAFLGTMEPGETKTVTFEVEAGGGAQPKEYAGSLEIRYEDEGGDSELADGIQIGVPVAPASGGLPLAYVGIGLGVVVLAGGVYTWRRD